MTNSWNTSRDTTYSWSPSQHTARVIQDMIGVVDQGHNGALVLLDLSAAFITSTVLSSWTYSDDGLESTTVL